MTRFLTVDQVANFLIPKLKKEDRNLLKSATDQELTQFHHGFGTFIRNDCHLWKVNDEDNDALLRDCLTVQKEINPKQYQQCKEFYKQKPPLQWPMHPDDASGVIIEYMRKKLINEEIEIGLKNKWKNKHFPNAIDELR